MTEDKPRFTIKPFVPFFYTGSNYWAIYDGDTLLCEVAYPGGNLAKKEEALQRCKWMIRCFEKA